MAPINNSKADTIATQDCFSIRHAENNSQMIKAKPIPSSLPSSKSVRIETHEIREIPTDKGYAWIIMTACFVNTLFAFGSVNAFGVFQTYYLVSMFTQEPAEKIAWISTLCIFSTFAVGLFVGPLVRMIGLRYTSLLGTILGSLGLLLASFSSQVWQLVLTQGIMFGSGCAIIVNISLTAPALWFDKRKNLAIGFVSSAGGFGALILIPVVTQMIKAVSIGWAFRLLCIIFFVSTGICGILTIPRTEYTPLNKIIDTKLLRDPVVFLLCLTGFFMEVGYNIPILYFPSSIIPYGISSSTATNLIMVFSVTSAMSRLFFGLMSKRLGSINIVIGCHTLSAVVLMALWYTSTNLAMSLGFYVLFGVFGVPFFALGPMIITSSYKPAQISQINALSYLFLGVAILISVPIVGAIFQILGKRTSYDQIIAVSSSFYFISALVAVILKMFLSKRTISSP